MKVETDVPVGDASPRKEQIQKVAAEFEAMFTSMMLKAMRSTIGDDSFMPQGTGEQIYTGMLDDEYAKMSSIGLSRLITKELEKLDYPESILQKIPADHTKYINETNAALFTKDFYSDKSDSTDSLNKVKKWEPIIQEASEAYGIDPALISAIITQESGGNQYAVSRAGAKGLMQLMDNTAQDLGVSQPFSPRANILAGTRYLRKMLDRFGSEQLALASYNAGPGAVEKYKGIPPYKETTNYVNSVLKLRERFSQSQ